MYSLTHAKLCENKISCQGDMKRGTAPLVIATVSIFLFKVRFRFGPRFGPRLLMVWWAVIQYFGYT